jgi:ApaG protein
MEGMEETEASETPAAGAEAQARADEARPGPQEAQNRLDDAKIRVDVETSFVQGESDPARSKYVFAYTITIRNEGVRPARLLTRHWIITDADGHVQEVRGDGVVGEQPYLKPGQGFRYTSGAVIETPVAVMQGSYQMVEDDGRRFDAPIAPFRLAMPGVLQ